MALLDFHTHQTASIGGIRNFTQIEKNEFDSYQQSCSVGLHPWWLTADALPADLLWLEQALQRPNVVLLGECGLDSVRYAADLSTQQRALWAQMQLANRYQKPMIIHCVRQFERLLHLRQKHQAHTPTAMVIHGFRHKISLLQQLLAAGCYVSFGAAISEQHLTTAVRALQATPLDRLFLETDHAPLTIGEVYACAARWLHLQPQQLAGQMQANYDVLSHFYKKTN